MFISSKSRENVYNSTGGRMEIMVGTIIKEDDKILMIQEGKKGSSCYGQWNFPSGHLEECENIFQGAIRETLEESGYKVQLKKLYPVQHIYYKEEKIRFFFLAEVEQKDENHHPDDILKVKWITIEEIKNMEKKLRDQDNNLKLLQKVEEQEEYPLNLIFDLF